MTTVNILEAKSSLSRLVAAVEDGAEAEIIIARNGKPAARLVPMPKAIPGRRLGVARGKFAAPEPDAALDAAAAALFAAGDE